MKNLLVTLKTNPDDFTHTLYVYDLKEQTQRTIFIDEIVDFVNLAGIENVNVRDFVDSTSRPVSEDNKINILEYKWSDIDIFFETISLQNIDGTYQRILEKKDNFNLEKITLIKEKVIQKLQDDHRPTENGFEIFNMEKPAIAIEKNGEYVPIPAKVYMFEIDKKIETVNEHVEIILKTLKEINNNKNDIYLYMFSNVIIGNKSFYRIRYGEYPNS